MVQNTGTHADAYRGRESGSTRNPHTAAVSAAKTVKDFSRLSTEERIIAQWRAAYGCPISDEAKAQFCITAVGRTFRLSDVRLWKQHHQENPAKNCEEKGTVYLEFFYDGTPSELEGNEEVFSKAFESMIEQQLQERRVVEFRKKLATRRRGKGSGGDAGGDDVGGSDLTDEDWRQFLHKPIPSTDFQIRSYREAGCMLLMLVCQTSLSVSASEVLGQIAFQEHFPIDGVAQDPSPSTKPLPRWVYGLMVCTAGLSGITLFAWWQVVRQIGLVGEVASESPFAAVG